MPFNTYHDNIQIMKSGLVAKLKPWILPLAMLLGILFHDTIGYVAFLSKYLIFVMLLITYSRISLHHFAFDHSMWWLLAIQIVGALTVYFALLPFNKVVAESIFICVFCSTATAAPVITGMLGGNVGKVVVFSLLSNFAIALLSPVILAFIGDNTSMTFSQSLLTIAVNVLPLLLGPLVVALLMRRFAPKAADGLAHHQGLSFYIWAVSLLIVVGNSVSFVMSEPKSQIPVIAIIAVLSLGVCLLQFYLGRKIGTRCGDAVAGAQSLGQKNTVLAIWLALTYLNPLSSIGPAFYIAWHNTVNSWQIARHTCTHSP